MKRTFITLLFSALVGMVMAQDVKTYSVYDTNQSGDLTIADVTATVNQVKSSVSASSTQQYVTADDLSTLLKSIQSDLKLIKEKLGIEDSGTETDTHEYVDLGLSSGTLWAKTNIGAESETDAGLYFAWGETTGYTSDTSDGHSFNWANYSLCNGSSTTMKKYCTDSSYGAVDNNTELDAADDAATANWGSKWCMPTDSQLTELRTECTWTWDSTNKGYKVTGTNGNSIFLPAAGYRFNGSLYDAGSYGCYWSRSLNSSYPSSAWSVSFYSGTVLRCGSYRCYGQSVRAVRSE